MTVPRTLENLRVLVMRSATGEVRTAVHMGKDHVVVPVVALVGDQVMQAVNSPTPELVPADEIRHSVEGWRGRPTVGDHPILNGEHVSANLPEVLESQVFGFLVDPRFLNNRLVVEAWLDPARAAEVGEDAVRVIERALDGDPIEVSVGVYINAEQREGALPDGTQYGAVWTDIMPDHLALLPEGFVGACSNEMGCGAPRTATVNLVTASGVRILETAAGTPREAVNEVLEVSPAQAQAWLDTAVQNNAPDPALIDAIAEDMRTGSFDYATSEKPIAFNYLGHLADGQHRLLALIEVGEPVDLQIIQWQKSGEDQVPIVMLAKTKKTARSRWQAVISRIKALARHQTEDEMSTTDLQSVLGLALEAADSDFLWVDSVYPTTHTVVYAIAVGDWDLKIFERGYSIEGEGVVTLAEDTTEVRPSITYIPVTAALSPADHGPSITAIERTTDRGVTWRTEFESGGGACSCLSSRTTRAHGAKETPMKTLAERIRALIESESTAYTDADEAGLTGMPESAIAVLEAAAVPDTPTPATPPTPEPAPATPPATPPTDLSEAEAEAQWEAGAPVRIRTILAGHRQVEQDRRDFLVAEMRDSGGFSAEELEAMPMETLEKVAKTAGAVAPLRAVDFSGAGPSDRPGANESIPPPLGVREAQAKYGQKRLVAAVAS